MNLKVFNKKEYVYDNQANIESEEDDEKHS